MEKNKAQQIQSQISKLKRKLSSPESPVGDWKGIKQREYVDAGRPAPYKETDMQAYYAERLAIRQQINTLEKALVAAQAEEGEDDA